MAAEKLRDTLMVPVAIPTWSLVSFLAVGIFSGGTIYAEIKGLSSFAHKSEQKVDLIFERQVQNIAAVRGMQIQIDTMDRRVLELERRKP